MTAVSRGDSVDAHCSVPDTGNGQEQGSIVCPQEETVVRLRPIPLWLYVPHTRLWHGHFDNRLALKTAKRLLNRKKNAFRWQLFSDG